MVRLRMVLLAVLVALPTVLLGAMPASAHNALTGSAPSDGAELVEAPAEVRLTFLARLNPDQSEVTVTAPDGTSAVAGVPDVDGSAVTVPLRPGPAGRYAVGYTVLSADGHRVTGDLGFVVTVDVPATVEPDPTPSAATPAPPSPTAQPGTDPFAGDPVAGRSDDRARWWPWALGVVALLAGLGAGAIVVRGLRRT